ncbi:Acg family FMN-binding oxidoreductase [Halomonas heilongjiangensis]|uniref:Tat pathway signal protein n=1 Tax=Halomonas heilongjiangensis TaxID=1387883 RepID=A0A2N7TU07_9GAMM|nr:Tat pathway signal protein [Halomonas heilongjiangensis]PMR71656.1 Tat pathway signal protein [Halomonas heilongjiangensis]PXX87222.1 Tat pathway signal protein [Halomonas heilongjiangensis]
MNYEQAVESIWRHAEGGVTNDAARLKELVRYATLAPSGHNTQCWRFRVADGAIGILPDLSRRTPVVDPDDHHLYVSLGCAAENLSLAARAFGMTGEVTFRPEGDGELLITLDSCRAEAAPLFEAIPARQCTRTDYDGSSLAGEELRLLEAAGTGRGVAVTLLTEREALEKVLEYVVQGNSLQVNNPAFRHELEDWIRFGDREAVEAGDGLSARVMGNPPTPRWLGRWLFRALFRERAENARVARQIRSSAGIAVFVSDADDRAHWVEAGRCYQRFALQATVLGIRNAFVNQPVEEAGVRPAFAKALGLSGGRPDLVVRFGRGKAMPRSLRRPIESVLIPPGPS